MRKITNIELNRPSVAEFSEIEKIPVVVVLDNIRSLQNVGSLFRTCDAFVAEELALCGITATPPNRDIHKTALGAELTVKWSYYPTTIECASELKQRGYKLIAIEQVEESIMLNDFTIKEGEKYAIILGNEVMGVDQEVVDICDSAIEIPQAGTKHSINVSIAGGVVLWSLFCQFQQNR
ncbi:MAG: RNA methyltransferase [Rikenellaceae bacterium]